MMSGGGKYHRWSAVKYLRVAAFLTPAASLALYSGSPVRRHSWRSQSCSVSRSPVSAGRRTTFVYWPHTSVTTGKRRMVLPLTLPATCPMPLSQMCRPRYSQSWRSSTGCTTAQLSSVPQNHSVVSVPACCDQRCTCGSYQSGSPATVGGSPGKPDTP